MTVVQDTLQEQLSRDLASACTELAAARTARCARDDTTNRQAVVRCQAQADALLDMYLDMYPALARPGPPPSAVGSGRPGGRQQRS
jgi:hypothetical protein